MGDSSTLVYPSIVNNSYCYFWGRSDIGSYISRHTPSFEHTYKSEKDIISFLLPSSNLTRKLLFPTTSSTHPTTSFLIILLLPSLVLSSISPTYSFTIEPTPIFIFIRFLCFISSTIVTTGDVMVDFEGRGVAIAVANSDCAVDFFCVKINSNKDQKPTKIA